MSVTYASKRGRVGRKLIQQESFPPAVDAAVAKGAWVIGPDRNMFYSDGENWLPSVPQGVEVIIPPWVSVPNGWFEVNASLQGDLANRTVIANKFDAQYILGDVRTWPVIDPAGMYSDAAGTIPVLSAPEPVGLIEDTTVPQINWFQDVTASRPTWKQLTRNGQTVNYLEFDLLGQEIKVNFASQVVGSMVHVTSNGIYITGVDIPAGTYTFGRWQIWPIEEIILLDRFLTSGEAVALVAELGRTRNRVTVPNYGTNWDDAFRDRTDIVSMPAFDFTGVTSIDRTFRNSRAENWLSGGFLSSAVNVTGLNSTFADNSITTIPSGLLDNLTSVTSMLNTFRNNELETIPQGLLANMPNLVSGGSRFGNGVFADNKITSVPLGLFGSNPNLQDVSSWFANNDITSIPENLFRSNPILSDVNGTFRNNDITFIPENLFANNPNLERVRETFWKNQITSIPENLFANNPNLLALGANQYQGCFQENLITSIPENLFANNPNLIIFEDAFKGNSTLTSVPAGLFDNQTVCTNYDRIFEDCALDQTSVDNVLVSVNTSAQANSLDNGTLGIDGGTNATPSVGTGQPAADALRARGWTVNLNGY